MSKLIEDNFTMEEFHHCLDCDSIIQVIESHPEAVVRCKNCKYVWHSYDGLRCSVFGTYDCDPIVNENEFCSRGISK